MKKNFVFIILGFTLLYFTGCKEKIVSSLGDTKTNQGGLLFKIDKVNAPKNVVMVEAVLSRTDFDTLKASLNLISDSSAEIKLNNIHVGMWHLNVNAYDSLNKVVYAGSADVNVQDGITTQVNLTLIPTSSGTGSIYIMVNWGTIPTSTWNDYEKNPVLTNLLSSVAQSGYNQQKILYDEGKFKMWFDVYQAGIPSNTGYAESYDGFTWKVVKENLFTFDNRDSISTTKWDADCVIPAAVLKENGMYKMFYIGHAGSYSAWQIGLAESYDGINWTKYAEPVFKSTNTEYQITAGDVVKVNGTYFMYYTYNPNPMIMPPYLISGICVATSVDGKSWKRSDANPILKSSLSWEGSKVYYPTIIVENDRFDMIYMDANATAFGMATSKDGFTWTKTSEKPIFTLTDTKGIKTYQIAYPSCRKINSKYFLYYSGTIGTNQQPDMIRVAVK